MPKLASISYRLIASLLTTLTVSAPAAFGQASASPLTAQSPAIAQARIAPAIVREVPSPSTIILPTDVINMPQTQNQMTFRESMQTRVLQKLPAKFYFNTTCETSLRYESNPFQFPTKRKFLTQLPQPPIFRVLSQQDQDSILNILGLSGNEDWVFRTLPNATAGFAVSPRTRVYGNYFMIRDSLFYNTRLNTVIHSIAYGAQHDFPLGNRASLQADFQARELYQIHQQPVFDFLPGLTLTIVATPRTIAFVNALMQIRGKKYLQAPTKEIDPFYTVGLLHQRGGWLFSASGTFVQNFREPFRRQAIIPVNNYSFICDFEVDRRLFRQLPGLQAFIRAEPIFNAHSHNRPGLAGMDFRLYMGVRFAVSKPALTTTLDQLRRQLDEQEEIPQPAPSKPNKPSAYLIPANELTAQSQQPIHGFLSGAGDQGSEVINPRFYDGEQLQLRRTAQTGIRPARTANRQPQEL